MKLSPKTGSAHPRENPNHWIGVEAEDIPQGWMDDMVKRLFEVLNREMIRLETDQRRDSDKKGPDGKPTPVDLEKSARRSRLAKDMEHSLEKLRNIEMKRQKARKPDLDLSDEQALAELERSLDELAAKNSSDEAGS